MTMKGKNSSTGSISEVRDVHGGVAPRAEWFAKGPRSETVWFWLWHNLPIRKMLKKARMSRRAAAVVLERAGVCERKVVTL